MNLTFFLLVICLALVISSDLNFNSTIFHSKLNPVENFKTESYQFLLKSRISESKTKINQTDVIDIVVIFLNFFLF